MKKMKVTKTLFTNKITYAYIGFEGAKPVTKQAELIVYSGEAMSDKKAEKILKSQVDCSVFIGVDSTSASYALDAEKFITAAEVVNV